MECSGATIFDLESLKPIYIGSVPTNQKHTHGKRLLKIENFMQELREKYPPKVVVIERGFSRFNTSTQVVYRVHGVVNKFFHDVEQVYYPPKTVKESIIRGDATKKLVQQKIAAVYPDVAFANEDESDSYAVALTYLIKNSYIVWEKDVGTKKKKEKKSDQ
jgi:Holliday junction resolvasome RuvABC endonuclease subunit